MSKLAKALTAAAGNAAGESLYVEDVFSTYLYEGDGQSNRDIVNGVNLADNGGLVWLKTRSTTYNHFLANPSEFTGYAQLPLTSAWTTSSNIVTFNTDGFRIPIAYSGVNAANSTSSMSSWSFRKAEKFFDVVTYTGDGSGDRVISHSLNSTPASIIMKKTSATSDWPVYHTGAGTGAFEALALNQTSATGGILNMVVGTSSSSFTVRSSFNDSGTTYIAYLFASDAGGFGDDGSESIIKCGSYGPGTETLDGPEVNLGFEPQWVLTKCYDNGGDWVLHDNMRGVVTNGDDKWLRPNTSGAELTSENIIFTSTGFKITSAYAYVNQSGYNYIYIAIRRPMKTPESGTEVFAVDDRAAATPAFVSDFPVDLYWLRAKTAGNFFDYARLRGDNYLQHDGTNAETSGGAFFDSNTGVGSSGSVSTNHLAWMFKRATGFFDVVAYTGDGVVGSTQAHNLGVAPEMMIVKVRNQQNFWHTYHKDLTSGHTVYLNATYASSSQTNIFNSTDPTDSVFTLGSASASNYSGYTYIAYLFATLAGVSKVGSYIGTGSNVDVDCGFSAGARFVLIKRTDSTGDWYVYDYFRGIVSGNDPYLLLNTGTGEVTNTDYIDPLSSGFTVTSSAPAALNASGGTYIFLAIA